MGNLRDYGLAQFGDTQEPLEKPHVTAHIDDSCPNCGCTPIYEITLRVKSAMLRGGEGVCKYIGCAACPWASPAMTTALGPRE